MLFIEVRVVPRAPSDATESNSYFLESDLKPLQCRGSGSSVNVEL